MSFKIKNKPFVASIMYSVCERLGITESEIKSNTRVAKVVVARALVCKLLRDGGERFGSIGLVVNRDHSSVIYLVNAHNKYLSTSEKYKEHYDSLNSINVTLRVIDRINYHKNKIEELSLLLK